MEVVRVMKRGWIFWTGVVLALAGTLLARLDIGSPSTANIVSIIGLGLVFWDFIRRGST